MLPLFCLTPRRNLRVTGEPVGGGGRMGGRGFLGVPKGLRLPITALSPTPTNSCTGVSNICCVRTPVNPIRDFSPQQAGVVVVNPRNPSTLARFIPNLASIKRPLVLVFRALTRLDGAGNRLPRVKGSTSGFLCCVCMFSARVRVHGQQENDKKNKTNNIGCKIERTASSRLTNAAARTQLATICR